jgi:hypothetical protein
LGCGAYSEATFPKPKTYRKTDYEKEKKRAPSPSGAREDYGRNGEKK